MSSTFRIAFGRCSCKERQPDALRRAICEKVLSRLAELRESGALSLFDLPPYFEDVRSVGGHDVTFETIREELLDHRTVVVVRAFVHSWRHPTWVSLHGVGHMFADGVVVEPGGLVSDAPDNVMWDFR